MLGVIYYTLSIWGDHNIFEYIWYIRRPWKPSILFWGFHHFSQQKMVALSEKDITKRAFRLLANHFPWCFMKCMYVYIYMYIICVYIYIHIIYTHINTYIIPLYFPWYPQVGFSSIQELDQGNTKPWGHPTGNKKPWVSCRLHQAIDCGSYSHILGDIWWYLHYKPGHIPIYPVSNWSFQYLS